MPDAPHRGGKAAVPPCGRMYGNPVFKNNRMTSQRIKQLHLRLTMEEAALLKEKSESYSSVSHFIRCAITEHSGVGVKRKLGLMKELGDFYRKYWNELSHIGGNLNQSVKRANELSVAGLLTPSYLNEVLLPVIKETYDTLDQIKRELDAVTKTAVKL